ncbi:MAG: hypothetical protein M1832_006220 [Thelocarpon impressellum]|nr:MAG: hypothetical protein M1832_006220 [Thelocarpon impressellum]
MKYVAEHTTIPLPKVYGYGFGGDYPTGLPFVLLEYIHGHTLIDAKYNTLDPARKRYLYRQLADIFIQLRQLEFDHMGALTLDEHGNPAFTNNRPLGIDFNDDQVDGQDPARMLKPHDVFTSTKASVRYLMKQAFHNYLRQRDAVGNEGNAKNHLYALHRMRDRALAWVDSRYDKGPFILMHGDLLPANIMVDADVRVLAVLDWEWSQTVPLQLLVPPYWLSGLRLELIGYKINIAAIAKEWSCLAESVGRTEEKWACRALARPLVSELWADVDHETMDSIFMAHALLNLDNMSSIYVRRFHYRDDDRREQFNRIFDMASNSTAQEYLSLVARKVEERKRTDNLVGNTRKGNFVALDVSDWTSILIAYIWDMKIRADGGSDPGNSGIGESL